MDAPAHKKTAIYMRVSTEEQRERQSIMTQRDFAERYTALHSIVVYGWYGDDGISGTVPLDQRPQGSRMLADAKDGKLTDILIYRLDRLGRDPRLILNAVNDLEQIGVQVRSMTEPFDSSTPAGRLMLTMLSGMAGFERDSIVQRSLEGQHRMARNGGWLGGRAPYGYHVEGSRQHMRIIPSEVLIEGTQYSEAGIIRLMFQLSANESKSCYAIADHLNSLDIPTHRTLRNIRVANAGGSVLPTSGKWMAPVIQRILKNTTYKGLHRYGLHGKGKPEIIEREVPPLVAVETWERAQVTIKNSKTFSPGHTKEYTYLLRGLIRCGLCGSSFSGTTGGVRGEKKDRYYRCRAATSYVTIEYADRARCRSALVSAYKLDTIIWDVVQAHIREPQEILERMAERIRGQRDEDREVREQLAYFEQGLQHKQQEKDIILNLFRRGRINESDLDRQLVTIQQEEEQLRAQMQQANDRLYQMQHIEESIQSAERLLQQLRARINGDITCEEKQHVIRALVSRVVVDTICDEDGKRHPDIRAYYRFQAPTKTGEKANDRDVIATLMDVLIHYNNISCVPVGKANKKDGE
jgi:site-specific DNA recombinase